MTYADGIRGLLDRGLGKQEAEDGLSDYLSDAMDVSYPDQVAFCDDTDALEDGDLDEILDLYRSAWDEDRAFADEDDRSMFAYPGGNSALRAESESNPRNLPCPTCDAPNRLTPADRAKHYQCDSCADRAEFGGY